MVARVAVATVAVLAIAWLGVMERDERMSGACSVESGESACRAVVPRRAPAEPGHAPDVLRSFLYLGTNRRAEGKTLVEDVVRREARQPHGVVRVFRISQGTDPALERRALAARRRLDPVNARR